MLVSRGLAVVAALSRRRRLLSVAASRPSGRLAGVSSERRRVASRRRRWARSIASVPTAFAGSPRARLQAFAASSPQCLLTRSPDHCSHCLSLHALKSSYRVPPRRCIVTPCCLASATASSRSHRLARWSATEPVFQPSTPSPALRRVRRAIQASSRRVLLAYSRTSLSHGKL